MVILVMEEGFE